MEVIVREIKYEEEFKALDSSSSEGKITVALDYHVTHDR